MGRLESIGKELWHYTDVNALDGILNKKEIWFSSTTNVNDSEEIDGFINKLINEVKLDIEGKDKPIDSEEVFSKIHDRLKNEYPYIFCVSKACDDAAQWERYADDGKGYAIVFNKEILDKVFSADKFTVDEVFYNWDAKRHELKRILEEYILTGKLNEFSNLNGYTDNLISCALSHKHRSFSSEQEIRISPVIQDKEYSKIENNTAKSTRKVLVVDLEKLCQIAEVQMEDLITEIVIGPKSERNIADLKRYLNEIGLTKLSENVRKADCPLR